ncbi:MAG: hypothetical protein LBV38_06355 [Alistipes sp.]|nr:hypothetical protein [Alistipes sp.]
MKYKIGNIEIDSDEYKEQFANRYSLPFMKQIIDMSGCTLLEAKQLIDKVIAQESIEMNPTALEMQNYCLAEYDDDE